MDHHDVLTPHFSPRLQSRDGAIQAQDPFLLHTFALDSLRAAQSRGIVSNSTLGGPPIGAEVEARAVEHDSANFCQRRASSGLPRSHIVQYGV